MVFAMAGFAINDAMVKSLAGMLPTNEIIAVRGLFVSVLIGLALWQRGLLSRFKEAITPLVVLRACMELAATLFFLFALVRLPFASISAILQSMPLLVTLGAAIVFRESVGWRRWLAIAIGFVGVLIIIRPGTGGFESASLFVVCTVFFGAARDLVTRALPMSLPSLLVSAVTAVVVTIYGFGASLIQGNWVPMDMHQTGVLAMASMFLFVGYQCIVLSMRTGEVAYVVPYRYTSLLFSIALGYVFFAEIPDGYTILGSAVVISMGLFTLYREIVRGRQARGLDPSS